MLPPLRIASSTICLALLATPLSRADLVDERYPVAKEPHRQIVNHGVIAGTAAQRFVFDPDSIVSGSGHFEHTLSMGVFAPGNSPGIVTGLNLAFAGTIQIELGGTSPGFAADNHDQINDAGTISLIGSPVLEILSFDNYLPTAGDTFVILNWEEGLSGSFASTLLDSHFITNGITFQQIITNPGGVGNLTLVAIPEANALLGVSLAGIAVVGWNRLKLKFRR